jgi:hypothetical protein
VFARLVDVHIIFSDTRYRVHGKKKMAIPETQETAGANFEHAHLPFARVNEEIAYMPNVFTIPIDDFAAANVLVHVGKRKVRIT